MGEWPVLGALGRHINTDLTELIARRVAEVVLKGAGGWGLASLGSTFAWKGGPSRLGM